MTKKEKDVKAAIEIIERLQSVAHNDMMARGFYISRYVEDQALADAGSVCNGHRACMIGSFFLAAGIPVDEVRQNLWRRDEIVEEIAGMKRARKALNKVSRAHPLFAEVKDEDNNHPEGNDYDAMEELFERGEVNAGPELVNLVLEITDNAIVSLKS